MEKKNLRLVFSSGIAEMRSRNASFDSGVLRVAYTGKNRNNSFISRETFERCMKSIYNCPIVCRYDRETDSLGAHDMEMVRDMDGVPRLVNVTQPVGVVPEGAGWRFEEVQDSGGIHEYLCVDVLLWKRQEAYQKIKRDGVVEESMEICVKDGGMEDGVFVIRDFEFTAFCLLGSAEPCYEGASLEVFALEEEMTQWREMMEDVKRMFATEEAQNQTQGKGGESTLNKKKTPAQDEDMEEQETEQTEAESAEPPGDENTPEQETEGSQAAQEEQSEEEFALESQIREALVGVVEAEKVDLEWGQESRYWLWDYDKELCEVYVTDTMDWNIYAMPYVMRGDNAEVDFSNKKRMQIALRPFDDGEPAAFAAVGARFALAAQTWTEKFQNLDKQWTEKYQSAEAELDGLRQFRAGVEQSERKEQADALFAQFEMLRGREEFEALKQRQGDFSLDELGEKLYAMLGRTMAAERFALKGESAPAAVKLPVEKGGEFPQERGPYGGLFDQYGVKKA